jgi:hypothetical protein
MKIHYLAYGSNLHPIRLQKRVSSAALIGTVELPGQALSFCKRSVDGSAKCTILENQEGQSVFAAVFEIDSAQKPWLDEVEGRGQGYDEVRENIRINGAEIHAFSYVESDSHLDMGLKPYHWYKRLVLAGAMLHRFPLSYIESIEGVESIDDPDEARRMRNETILGEVESNLTLITE